MRLLSKEAMNPPSFKLRPCGADTREPLADGAVSYDPGVDVQKRTAANCLLLADFFDGLDEDQRRGS